ncbi:uncharacterized protein LOC132349892 [Balaenoptera ricei]|uniref:uncharacterized protein LOC132349892 n=1 Tax=Balaenoptera ricei TaxID=2746895 RepID=UPI0028BD4BD2|nr:uncharacterized protein LOC132349892 [Balaenoptera ricei]
MLFRTRGNGGQGPKAEQHVVAFLPVWRELPEDPLAWPNQSPNPRFQSACLALKAFVVRPCLPPGTACLPPLCPPTGAPSVSLQELLDRGHSPLFRPPVSPFWALLTRQRDQPSSLLAQHLHPSPCCHSSGPANPSCPPASLSALSSRCAGPVLPPKAAAFLPWAAAPAARSTFLKSLSPVGGCLHLPLALRAAGRHLSSKPPSVHTPQSGSQPSSRDTSNTGALPGEQMKISSSHLTRDTCSRRPGLNMF